MPQTGSDFRKKISLGFHKIGTDRWEFANEDFQRGKRALLKHINRRRSSQAHNMHAQVGSSVEMGKALVENEVQKLRREKDLLMQEVRQLRTEQLMTVEKMDSINHRMQAAELRQKQMVSFLAKVLQNPTFIGHLKQLKGQGEIASVRGKRKFFKYHQQPIFRVSAESMNQQVKYGERGEGTGALKVFERNEGHPTLKHLLKGIADKLDLDTGGEVIEGSDESVEGSDGSEDLKGKNIVSPQMESEFPGSDYLVSLPVDISTFANEYISQEAMFPDAITPANDCVTTGAWNVDLEAEESFFSCEPVVWDDSLGREMETAVGSCSLWDLGLNTLEEDLDIANYLGGESPLQEHKDDGGRPNADCSKNLEP